MTDKLIAKDVLKAAAQARAEGRLGFQNPEVLKANGYGCLYRYPETNVVCGVGAGITDEQFQALKDKYHHHDTISGIVNAGVLKISLAGLRILSTLQSRHDSVVSHMEEGLNPAEKIADFDRFLDAKLAELEAA